MNELLKKLLEADILTEETKADLEQAFQSQLNEAISRVEAETSERVRVDLTEQWIKERDVLIEAVDTKVGQMVDNELKELASDIERFRDLEAEYSQKLVESKQAMTTELQKDMEELVEKLNTFLEIRLTQEIDELKEDLQEAKKLQFGRELFEGFVSEYRKNFVSESGVEAELVEARKELAAAKAKLTEATTQIQTKERETKMAKLLNPLQGKQREVMESILTNVATERLDEGYKTFIGRVIKESDEKKTETKETTVKEESKVLAETVSEDNKKEAIKGKIKTGDTEKLLQQTDDSESTQLTESAQAERAHLMKLAGIQ